MVPRPLQAPGVRVFDLGESSACRIYYKYRAVTDLGCESLHVQG